MLRIRIFFFKKRKYFKITIIIFIKYKIKIYNNHFNIYICNNLIIEYRFYFIEVKNYHEDLILLVKKVYIISIIKIKFMILTKYENAKEKKPFTL